MSELRTNYTLGMESTESTESTKSTKSTEKEINSVPDVELVFGVYANNELAQLYRDQDDAEFTMEVLLEYGVNAEIRKVFIY